MRSIINKQGGGYMPLIESIQIFCPFCNKLFDSPVFFDDIESFKASDFKGSTAKCPYCQQTVAFNKEDLIITLEDGTKFNNRPEK